MNGHLLDTSTVRQWFARNTVIEGKIKALPASDLLYLSSVTYGEIEFGHQSIRATDPVKQAEFRRWMTATFQRPVLSITQATALHYASLRRIICDNYFRKGKHVELFEDMHANKLCIDENDLWLVAQAHERRLEFITSDKMTRIREVFDGKVVMGEPVRIDYWPP